jgi:zinc transporter ZupT
VTAFLLSIIAAAAAFGGGLIAIRGRKNLNAALGFTAGVILGLVAFDLLPEIFGITRSTGLDPTVPMVTLVTGFLLFHIVEKFILLVAFQVGSAVGTAVAIAVISHRFADGFNTTNVMLRHKNKPKRAMNMLIIAALMPVLGVLLTQLVSFSESSLAIYLGFFAGFLLYIGASDILPQAHSQSSSRTTIGLTVLGAVFMFAVTRLA